MLTEEGMFTLEKSVKGPPAEKTARVKMSQKAMGIFGEQQVSLCVGIKVLCFGCEVSLERQKSHWR